jgi:P pilus assembly chaperone PapD
MSRSLRLSALLISAPVVGTLRSTPVQAQGVMIAPHVVYMDHRTRSGSLTLYNPGNDPVEVSIETFFGYPVTDSTGGFELRTVEHPDSTMPSAAGWVQAYPRRMTVPPQQRQTVRLLGRPPANLADGEYWARLIVTAKGGQVPVTGLGDSTGITVGLTLEVRTILPVLYRKGPVTTGVAVSGLRASVQGDSLVVRARMVRTGSAAFVGTVHGALVDVSGNVVARFSFPQAVYFDMEPRFTTAVAGLPRGQYRLRFEATSERQDLPSEVILPMAPVRDSIQVALP